jgi:hypothetical protein
MDADAAELNYAKEREMTLAEARDYINSRPSGVAGILLLAGLDEDREELRVSVAAVGFDRAGAPTQTHLSVTIPGFDLAQAAEAGPDYIRHRVEMLVARAVERAMGLQFVYRVVERPM